MLKSKKVLKVAIFQAWLVILVMSLMTSLSYAQGSGVTITVVRAQELWTADPLMDTQATSTSVFQNVFDPLVRVNWDNPGEPLPALAASWKILSPTSIQFNLRKNVRWHDGKDFTAEDVKFTFDRVLNKQKPTKVTSWIISIVKSVSIQDDHTVVIDTHRPYAPIFPRLDVVKIVPKATFNSMGAEKFGQKPVGTGAYILDEWVKGQYIRLKANESWWGWVDRETRPDVVIRKSIAEDFTRYATLKSGEADIVSQISPERIPEIEATKGLRVATVPSLRGFFVGMNTRKPPFDNIKVRQAMNHAIDPQLIVETILGGQAMVHTGVCARYDFGYNSDLKPYVYDPDRAKELLAEAGYPNGFKVKFWSPRGKYVKDLETSEAIAGQLEEIGIQVEVYAPAWPEYWDNFLGKKMDMYLLSYGGSFPDCDDRIGGHLDGARRGIYYSTAFSDDLIKTEQQTLDPVKRKATFDMLSKYFHDQAPWIFLWDQVLIYGMNNKIKECKPVPVEHLFYWDMKVK